MKVLVIEDEQDIAELIEEEFKEGFECEVDIAVDGLDGFLMAKEKVYDLITIDYSMPIMNGIDFLHAIKNKDNKCKKSKMIFISGLTEMMEESENILMFEKPIDFKNLIRFSKALLPH